MNYLAILTLLTFHQIYAINTGRTRPASSANIQTQISSPSSLEFKQSAELSCVFDLDSVEIDGEQIVITVRS